MRLAEVIGRVTLAKSHASLQGARFVLVLPLPRAAIIDNSPARGEDVVAYDDLGASPGGWIGLSEGREAANPFGKTKTPIDAYCACLIDQIST